MCVGTAQKEAELKRLEQRIKERQDYLDGMNAQAHELSMTMKNLVTKVQSLENAIDQEVRNWTK